MPNRRFMFVAVLLAAAIGAAPTPEPVPTLSPRQLLGAIRQQFRSHRPPPAYETYTLVRKQNASNGYMDPTGSYTAHYFVRNSDRAALYRYVYRDFARGDLTFDRPAFNEDRDPGPPTADLFEPAPAIPHPVSQAYTPDPGASSPPVIGIVRGTFELDYSVQTITTEGDELHLIIVPLRDPDRNRLREIYVDKRTLELHKLVGTDKLFYGGAKGKVYPVIFTITMGNVGGFPVVTRIHGDVGGGYDDDGKQVDYTFKDIKFPATLPDWYFDPRSYASHVNEAPL